MQSETKKRLVVPAVLAVAVHATGCVTNMPTTDAAVQDTAVADAGTDTGFDAGCIPPEEYDPVSHSCVPIV